MISNKKARRFKKKLEGLLSSKEVNLEEFIELIGGIKHYNCLMERKVIFKKTRLYEMAHVLTKSTGEFGTSSYKIIGKNYANKLWKWQDNNLSRLREAYSQGF